MNSAGIRWTGFLVLAWGAIQVYSIKQSNEQRVQDIKHFEEYERAKERSYESFERTGKLWENIRATRDKSKYPISSLDQITPKKDPDIFYLLIAAGFIVLSFGYYGDKELQDKNRASTSKAEENKSRIQQHLHQGKGGRLVSHNKQQKIDPKITINCPHCDGEMSVTPFPNERVMECRHCSERFVVPAI